MLFSCSIPRDSHKRSEKRRPYEDLCRDGHSSVIYDNAKLETTQMSIGWWTDKQTRMCLFQWNQLSNKIEWNIDTCYNMDKPQNHYSKWEKPVKKQSMLYDSLYVKFLEKGKTIETESIFMVAWS